MYSPEALLQRNLVVLECVSPKLFKDKVYYYLDTYSNLSLDAVMDSMNALSQVALDKNLDMSMSTVERLLDTKKMEEVSLIAQLNALATLVAFKSVTFQKPLSWWINTSLQLVDVSMPTSDTLH
jgi:hypothetical protein